jgi:hypothetical protein
MRHVKVVFSWSPSAITNDANLLNTRSSNPHAKTQIPQKPSKLGLIGVWHKDNLYLDTTILETKTPTQQVLIREREGWCHEVNCSSISYFFSFLKNQGREIIPPTHNKYDKRSLLIWKLCNPYMSGCAFIYTDSRLKQTLLNPLCGLIWGPLAIKCK